MVQLGVKSDPLLPCIIYCTCKCHRMPLDIVNDIGCAREELQLQHGILFFKISLPVIYSYVSLGSKLT